MFNPKTPEVLAPDLPAGLSTELQAEQAELLNLQRRQQQLIERLDLPPYDLNRYVSEIRADMVNSATAMLRMGSMLAAVREHETAERFNQVMDQVGLSRRQGLKILSAAVRFRDRSAFAKAADSSSKLLSLLTEDDETLDAIETGSIVDLTLDDVERMSTRELRSALRKARQDKEAIERVNADKNAKIDQLTARLDTRNGGAVEARLTELMQTLDAQVLTAQGNLRNLTKSIRVLNEFEAELGESLDPGTAERIANARAACVESLQAALALVEE